MWGCVGCVCGGVGVGVCVCVCVCVKGLFQRRFGLSGYILFVSFPTILSNKLLYVYNAME